MPKEHHVIVIPGLGDDRKYLAWEIRDWQKFGLNTHLHIAHWGDRNEQFDPKLERLVRDIDQLSAGGIISLVGISAGGSLALNAFAQRKEEVHRVAIVCAPLRIAESHTLFWRHITSRNPALVKSLSLAEHTQTILTVLDKKKILTSHALYDEQVPNSTTTIEGARNILIPVVGHQLALTLAMTMFRGRIIDFIKQIS